MTTTKLKPQEIQMSEKDWRAEGQRLFGKDYLNWKFVCPGCGNIASGSDFKEVGAEPWAMYQECIGRYKNGSSWMNSKVKKAPCDYAAYGLFKIAPVVVNGTVQSFAFAAPSSEGKS